MPLPYKKILIVRTDRLGDVLLTLPLFPVLREWCPGASLGMLVRRYPGELVEGNPHVDSILRYDRGGRPVPFRELLAEIRAHRFDAAVVARPTGRIGWLLRRAGIPIRVGTGYRVYSLLFNRRVYEHRKSAERHEMEYNLRLLAGLGIPPPPLPFTPDFGIRIPPDVDSRMRQRLRVGPDGGAAMSVVIHPGSGGSAREWPVARFAELARRLHHTFGCQVIVTGSGDEVQRMMAVQEAVGGRALLFPGTLSLKELAAVLRSASLVISNSTGPLHLAVAVGSPVLGLYPPVTAMSARRWGPYSPHARVLEGEGPPGCSACERGGPCACMEAITVDRAFVEAKAVLEIVKENSWDADVRG